jgi:hypothetical protein
LRWTIGTSRFREFVSSAMGFGSGDLQSPGPHLPSSSRLGTNSAFCCYVAASKSVCLRSISFLIHPTTLPWPRLSQQAGLFCSCENADQRTGAETGIVTFWSNAQRHQPSKWII